MDMGDVSHSENNYKSNCEHCMVEKDNFILEYVATRKVLTCSGFINDVHNFSCACC